MQNWCVGYRLPEGDDIVGMCERASGLLFTVLLIVDAIVL